MKIAVLGCGSIGCRHLKNLLGLGWKDLVAFDPVVGGRDAAAALGVRVTGDLDEVWEEKPAVALIAAPTHLHLPLALRAAERRCHLFIEKPLGHEWNGVETLLQRAEERRLVTLVGCNMRFHPGPACVKRLLEEGAAGRVLAARLHTGSYLPEWRASRDYRQTYSTQESQGGGAILDCIHEIDLALWYFGEGSVVGAALEPATHLGIETEGLGEILIRHRAGCLSSVHLNFVQRDYRRCCQILGERGTIYWDFELPFVLVDEGGGWKWRWELDPGWEPNQMYLDELRYFLECVENGRLTFCGIREGAAALSIALAAKQRASLPAGDLVRSA